jgi:WD40 repeat protein
MNPDEPRCQRRIEPMKFALAEPLAADMPPTAQPAVPRPHLILTAPATFTLQAGESKLFPLGVGREQFEGAVCLRFQRLPAGLRASTVVVPPTAQAVTPILSAAAETTPGEYEIEVECTNESLPACTICRLTIMPRVEPVSPQVEPPVNEKPSVEAVPPTAPTETPATAPPPKPGLFAEVSVAELAAESKHKYFSAAAPLPLVICSADGQTLGIAGRNAALRLVDAATGAEVKQLPLQGHGTISGAAFSPDGGSVFTLTSEKLLTIWDAATVQPVNEYRLDAMKHYPPDDIPRFPLAMSASCRWLVNTKEGEARMWNAGTGKEVSRLGVSITSPESSSAIFTPDEQHVLLQTGWTTFRVHDRESGHEVHQFVLTFPTRGATASSAAAAFSADGQRLCAVAVGAVQSLWKTSDGILRFQQWDVATGQEVSHADAVVPGITQVTLSLDGSRALTAGRDGSLRLWDTTTGQQVYQFPGHPKGVVVLGFTQDGRRAFSAGLDGFVRVWQLP